MHHLPNTVRSSTLRIDFDIAPLVKAIHANSAIVYVGAGASIPSGLPSWHEFLNICLLRAQTSNPPGKFDLTKKLLNNGEYLLCAELLQNAIGPKELEEYVRDIYGKEMSPSLVHHAIRRIPFSLALTTNYDILLECSYPRNTEKLTWKEQEDIFRVVKQNKFAIIKIHGDPANGGSIVLTSSQYKNLMNKNENNTFNDTMKMLLALRTFLFVGSSLRDLDLLRLMDYAKLTYRDSFGPHYAILFEGSADNLLLDYFKKEYNLNVIFCKKPKGYDGENWRTQAVCSFLTHLSGLVSSNYIKNERIIELDSPTFNLQDLMKEVLIDTVIKTGAENGKIALIQNENLQSLYLASEISLKEILESPDKKEKSIASDRIDLIESKAPIPPDTIYGNLFLKGGDEDRFIYINGENNDEMYNWEKSSQDTYPYADLKIKSILAIQILADGQKVGILSIGSTIQNAFTNGHFESLEVASSYLGAIYTEFKHRKLSSKGIDPYLENMTIFQRLMDMSRHLRKFKISYLIYKVDYENGVVIAKYDPLTVKVDQAIENKKFGFHFDEKSLATEVLIQQKEIIIEDAEIDSSSENPILSPKGLSFFGIKGSVYGLPLRVDGHISTVLVAWSRTGNVRFSRWTNRILRLAHVIANSPDSYETLKTIEKRRAYQFFEELSKNLKKVDNDEDWGAKRLKSQEFRTKLITEIMKTLTHPSCGLARVRLFEFNDSVSNPEFKCIYSYTLPEATAHGKDVENDYLGFISDGSDPYSSHTIRRALKNPNALIQHKSMFGKEDKYCAGLNKNPEGSWIVCPVVYSSKNQKKLLGQISADNHFPSNPKISGNNQPIEKIYSEREYNFQKFCIELATDLLVHILRFEMHDKIKR